MKIKKTSRFEKYRELRLEYEAKTLQLESHPEMQRYVELVKILSTEEFTEKKRSLQKTHWLGSKEEKQFDSYQKLQSDKNIKGYLKIKKHPLAEQLHALEESGKIDAYEELEAIVNTKEFKPKVKQLRKSDQFSGSKEEEQLQAMGELAKELNIYLSIRKKRDYQRYRKAITDNLASAYTHLNELVHSDEFQKKMAYLKDKNRYKKTENYKLEMELEKLLSQPTLKYYFKMKQKYGHLRDNHWIIFNEDNFPPGQEIPPYYETSYGIAKKFFKEPYSIYRDNVLLKKENLEPLDYGVNIHTRKEEAQGMSWHNDKTGFGPRRFDFTSGMLNFPLDSFEWIRIEIKAKLNYSPGIKHAIWLRGDKGAPVVTLGLVNDSNHIQYGKLEGDKDTLKRLRLSSKKYYYFGLEQTDGFYNIYLNGTLLEKVPKQTFSAPHLLISSMVTNKAKAKTCKFHVDRISFWKDNSIKWNLKTHLPQHHTLTESIASTIGGKVPGRSVKNKIAQQILDVGHANTHNKPVEEKPEVPPAEEETTPQNTVDIPLDKKQKKATTNRKKTPRDAKKK